MRIQLIFCAIFTGSIGFAITELEQVPLKEEIEDYIGKYQPSSCKCDELDFAYISNIIPHLIKVALQKNKGVKSLNMSSNGLDGSGLQEILSVFPVNKIIESIDLSNNKIGSGWNVAAEVLAKYKIKKLILDGNNIGTDGLKAILDALLKKKAIKSLNLVSNELKDEGALLIAAFLRRYSGLTELVLGGNKIGGEGVLAIVDALRKNSAGISLDLSGNVVDAKDMVNVAKILPQTNIKKLYLWDSGITDDHVKALAEVLPDTRLTEIIFYLNDITDEGVKALLNVLPRTKIKKIDLFNNYGIKNLQIIDDFTKNNPAIEILTGEI